jgi:hypothetical protein
VFCSPTGAVHDEHAIRLAFYAALERAGLGDRRRGDDPIIFHDLRHTFGTLAVQAWPLSDVRGYMGHADISTTMVYAHDVPRHDVAERLSRVVSGSGTSCRTEQSPLPQGASGPREPPRGIGVAVSQERGGFVEHVRHRVLPNARLRLLPCDSNERTDSTVFPGFHATRRLRAVGEKPALSFADPFLYG